MKSRDESLQIAALKEFDLLVVGGGIAGAGIAQNAASRGLSVVLIDKNDFASGTSSRTTKLIHGGLRYLEQMRLKLTSKLCRERALLQKLAPHMVRDTSFILPLTKRHRLFNLKANLGLTLYDMVSWSAGISHHMKHLSAQDVFRAAPSLSAPDIQGGLAFHDCVTDDARLVLAVIKSACHEGGIALNYVEAKGFIESDNQILGAVCRDRVGGRELSIRAKSVVNATGVWCDRVGQLAEHDQWAKRITASKGIHIIVPASAFETNSGLFLPTDDNRYVFVVPWQRAVMIGTTETFYNGDPDNPLPALDEIDYLLSVVNSYSAHHRLNRSDINGTFAGLRPLVRFESGSEGADTGLMSREHLTFESSGGMINVAGGKLTSYRLMAEEAVDMVLSRLHKPGLPGRT
jgi:glycerol-3-phosphate dehydrogenase